MGGSGKDPCPPQLLDLIPKERRGWKEVLSNGGVTVEERQLELRLWPTEEDGKMHPPSLGLSAKKPCSGAKRGFLDLDTAGDGDKGFQKQQHQQKSGGGGFQHYKADGMVVEEEYQLGHERKARPPAIAGVQAAVAHDKPQSRNTAAPIVGWPPVRSFRKNIASTSKSPPESRDVEPKKPEKAECSTKGLFLKINMDGIPIGRKIDLNAYKSYKSLSVAVDELFRGLLAAQREPHVDNEGGSKEPPAITGLLDGSGEYTLVYEDSDGDRILAGDVPWEMFVSAAKRLHVLKTSQLSTLPVSCNHHL